MSETDWSAAVADRPAAADFAAACAHARQVAVLASVESLVHWDEQTMLPARAGGFRADQAEAMAAVVHARRTDQRLTAYMSISPRCRWGQGPSP